MIASVNVWQYVVVYVKENLVSCLIYFLASIVSIFLMVLIKKVCSFISKRNKEAYENSMLKQIQEKVKLYTKEIQQTFVDPLKKRAQFTVTRQKEAKDKTISLIKLNLNHECLVFIKSRFGDVDEYLSAVVESCIFDLHGKVAE